jgi:5-methyltetrahydrofolate--homocysteine methyltransferase
LNADAIGLSALLVSTSKQMPLIVNEFKPTEIEPSVLIGGAAINEKFGRRILMTEQNELYDPVFFYCRDAFEGLATMDSLVDPKEKPALMEKIRHEASYELGLVREKTVEKQPQETKGSSVPPAKYIPRVDEYGPVW